MKDAVANLEIQLAETSNEDATAAARNARDRLANQVTMTTAERDRL